ncbi:MAG: DUF1566 domain-containing protein [Deltaproteobacteria bacterium]|nr:DUF1566 domain-containing protein [Deltaproteobacteria bacterium]
MLATGRRSARHPDRGGSGPGSLLTRIASRALAVAVAVPLTACLGRQPFVVLSIEDPTGAATDFTTLAVGLSRESLAPLSVSRSAFPLAVTVTTSKTGEASLWVEARGANDAPLARGTTTATFARTGTPTATVKLAKACTTNGECNDGLFCTATVQCVDGVCQATSLPCVSAFPCLVTGCVELGAGEGACSVAADHSACPAGQYCNPAAGCIPGNGCQTAADCQDGFACNGGEQCVNFLCVSGAPPNVDDGDTCTLDGCDDGRVASNMVPVFHVAQASFDGSTCVIPGTGAPGGVCVAWKGGCVVSECGDRVVDRSRGEECDDGNLDDQDACLNDCRRARCGDGVIAPLEACDDAGESATCNADCSQSRCGDRVPNATANEECDDGANHDDCDGCLNDCMLHVNSCGDGFLCGTEACDDGGESLGCNLDCTPAECGDGKPNLTAGEECDGGGESAGCNLDCTVAACGDRKVNATAVEQCDDGANDNDCDGCLNDCTLHANRCGDGYVCGGEQCDGGGESVACNADCTTAVCGDTKVNVTRGEACDGGSQNDNAWALTRHCNGACTAWAPSCGDLQLDSPAEVCDAGNANGSGTGCSATCQRAGSCGDGTVQSLYEQCDDGDGDQCNGCRTDCQRGCICTAPGACVGANWCSQGLCVSCNVTAHCGAACVACGGATPLCGGVGVGCQCDPSPAPRGSCGHGSYCSGGACLPCDSAQYCGQDCVACGGSTPTCGGAEVGCITTDCATQPDFTLCQVVTTPDRSYDICVDGVCVSPGCGDASCNAHGPGFALADSVALWAFPDNNQRACFDATGQLASCPGTAGSGACFATAFCGQDAQYGWDPTHADPSVRWTRTGGAEPVTLDNLTGLIWQEGCASGSGCAIAGAYVDTWDQALAYCDGLVWSGYADWRLPDYHESQSILDLSQCSPSIDATAFAGTAPGTFWTSTTHPVSLGWAYYALFYDGSASNADQAARFILARCVRSGPSIQAWSAAARFTRTVPSPNQPVVADARTKLMWQGCAYGLTGSTCTTGAAGTHTWQAALGYCEGLGWGGFTNWRLPSRAELASILDLARYNPAIDPTAFPATPTGSHWSSTSAAGFLPNAWSVAFADGWIDDQNFAKTTANNVRCVRPGP